MTEHDSKGHVEFKQPRAKMVADLPEDDEMRDHIETWQAHDGYHGSCGLALEQKYD